MTLPFIFIDWVTTTWVARENKVAPGIRTSQGSNPQRLDKGVEAISLDTRA